MSKRQRAGPSSKPQAKRKKKKLSLYQQLEVWRKQRNFTDIANTIDVTDVKMRWCLRTLEQKSDAQYVDTVLHALGLIVPLRILKNLKLVGCAAQLIADSRHRSGHQLDIDPPFPHPITLQQHTANVWFLLGNGGYSRASEHLLTQVHDTMWVEIYNAVPPLKFSRIIQDDDNFKKVMAAFYLNPFLPPVLVSIVWDYSRPF